MNDSELEFQKLYDAFQPRILRYLIRLVGENEAEDVTQETFVRVSQALENFRGESKLSTWLYRIATNAALDRLRSPSFQRIAQKKLSDDSIEKSEVEAGDKDIRTGEKAPSVEQQFVRKEMNKCIRDFIEELQENYRTAVVLSELEGLKNTEIAEVLGVSLDTIKIRLHRARAKLKKELETHCDFYRDEGNEFACDLKTAFKEFRKTN